MLVTSPVEPLRSRMHPKRLRRKGLFAFSTIFGLLQPIKNRLRAAHTLKNTVTLVNPASMWTLRENGNSILPHADI